MGKYAKWELDGWIASDFEAHLNSPDGIDRVLQDTGVYGVKVMRDITKESDVSKRLTRSIMYITNTNLSSAVRGEYPQDTLQAPTTKYTLFVGSGAPHAPYRETYSGLHRSSVGKEDFEKSLKEWCAQVLNINPDGSEEDKNAYHAIKNHIQNNITEGKPFVLPNIERITKYGLLQLKKSVIMYLNSKAHKEGK